MQFNSIKYFIFFHLLFVFYNSSICSLKLIASKDSFTIPVDKAEIVFGQIIKDPVALINKIQPLESNKNSGSRSCVSGVIKSKKNYSEIIADRDNNIVSCISECRTCDFSRKSKNDKRSLYEETVLKYLNKSQNKENINYVSFSSGELFQDLVILTKAVKLYNIKNITIHLIDILYDDVISYMQNNLSAGNVWIFENNEFEKDKINLFTQYFLRVKEKSNGNIDKSVLDAIYTYECLKEFTDLMKHLSNNITVYVHKNVKAYQDFCLLHDNMRADIVTAIDFDVKCYGVSLKDYYSLIYNSLKKGCYAILAELYLPDDLSVIERYGVFAVNIGKFIKNNVCNFYKNIFFKKDNNGNYCGLRIKNGWRNFVGVFYKKEEFSLKDFDDIVKKCSVLFSQKDSFDILEHYKFLLYELPYLNHNKFINKYYEVRGISTARALQILGSVVFSYYIIKKRLVKIL